MYDFESAVEQDEIWTPARDFAIKHKDSFMQIRSVIDALYPEAADLSEGTNHRIPTNDDMNTLYRNFRIVMQSFYSAKNQDDDQDDTWIPARDYTSEHEDTFRQIRKFIDDLYPEANNLSTDPTSTSQPSRMPRITSTRTESVLSQKGMA